MKIIGRYRVGSNITMDDIKPGANLRWALLCVANLQGVDLRGVDLRHATLCKTNMSLANLEKADLRGVDLLEANLQGANLRGADLRGANITEANLEGAKYDKNTKFFDPEARGMINPDEEDNEK